MKYQNGRTPKVGDHVAGADSNGRPVVGIVGEIVPTKEGARLTINPLRLPAFADASACIHVDDVMAETEENPDKSNEG